MNFSFRKFFKNKNAPKLSYIHLAYFATMATGFASLCAQVVWQKYLTILVGSDTRSINLVIAVFLLGLAFGYYVFGKITERSWSRFLLLKFYGWLEMATAIYIVCFYIYFELLKQISFNTPSYLFIDILVSLLALFFPTFLMGASIPVLTTVLPKSSEEINAYHFKIYGWNVFGAFLGVLFAGFYLLPLFGLSMTLIIAGAINFISALIFIGNNLEGKVHKQKEYVVISSRIPNWFYIFFSFFVGAVIVSFEVLFIRLLHLSVGAGVYNFPIILSLFIGGLSLGSLSVSSHKASPSFFIKQILITITLLGLVFIASPYWVIWISHIRVSLLSIPSNYFVFKTVVYLFLAFFLLPFIFFMGRLLPLSYILLKKTKDNYGSVCGYLYFFNTLGTVCGTIVLGYLAFYIFNLDELFRVNIFFLIALAFTASFYEKRWVSLAFTVCLAVFLIALPEWNRSGHVNSFFRTRQPQFYHFKKLFSIPDRNKDSKLLFFGDGPNVSVSLMAFPEVDKYFKDKEKLFPLSKYQSVSYFVNGKAIANSLGDFSTMFLMSSLAYFYAPDRVQLSSAVVGLGSGVSAGVLSSLEEIKDTTVLEIAPEVVENVRRYPDFSFGLLDNPKAKIIEQDGFKYFTKTNKKFDIIVSEPSNPWVVGVENVFSYEFYELVKKTLKKDGILAQWVQLYSIDADTLRIMFHTLKKVFPYAKVYKIGRGDIIIVSSPAPLKAKIELNRFSNSVLKFHHSALGLYEIEDFVLTQVFSEDVFSDLAGKKTSLHTLTMPKLAYRSDKTLFLGHYIEPEYLVPDYFSESSKLEDQKIKAFEKYDQMSPKDIQERCLSAHLSFFCNLLVKIKANKTDFEDESRSPLLRLNNYIYLRKKGLIKIQSQYLEELKKEMIDTKLKNSSLFLSYLNQLLSNRLYEEARADLALFQKKGLLTEEALLELQKHIKQVESELSSQ